MAQAIHLQEAIAFAGPFPLLAGVDFEVEIGEVVHLNGANGAGKTSLLRALAGLVPVSAGAIEVLGYDLRVERRAVRSQVGLLGHQGFLYEDLDARSNLSFWLRGMAGADAVERSLDRVGLADRLLTTPVARLSTGQRRRVALALFVARSPKLWLLDEPHAGLDVEGRKLVDGLVGDAVGAGATVILSSHELDYVRSLSTRSVTMSGGRIVGSDVTANDGRLPHDA